MYVKLVRYNILTPSLWTMEVHLLAIVESGGRLMSLEMLEERRDVLGTVLIQQFRMRLGK